MKNTILYILNLLLPLSSFSQTSQLKLDTCKQLHELNEDAGLEFVKFKAGEASDSTKFYNQICNCIYVDYLSNGLIHEKGRIENCEKNGKWTVYGDSAKVIRIINYNNGKRHGEFISYWGNGQLAIHCFYKDGNYDGIYEEFDFYGNLVERVTYDNGKVVNQDKRKDWEPDGVIQYEWPSLPKQFRKKEKPGVYIWNNGELIFLRSFEDQEIKTGNPDLELNQEAKKEFYERKK